MRLMVADVTRGVELATSPVFVMIHYSKLLRIHERNMGSQSDLQKEKISCTQRKNHQSVPQANEISRIEITDELTSSFIPKGNFII